MAKEFLNDPRIRALKAMGTRLDVTDAGARGLRLRLLPGDPGRCIWSFRYRNAKGEKKAFVIGEYDPPHWTIAAAREEAIRLRVLVRAGACPQTDRDIERQTHDDWKTKTADPTFANMADDWFRAESESWSLLVRAHWARYIAWAKVAFGKRQVDKVTPDDIRGFIDAIKNGTGECRVRGERAAFSAEEGWGDRDPVWFQSATAFRKPAASTAKDAFAAIRRAFVWGVSERRVAVSPCDQAKAYRRRKNRHAHAGRVKHLTDAQLRGVLSASAGTSLEHFVRLVLLTGVRAHEAMSARWENIQIERRPDGGVDLERSYWRVPAPMTKTKVVHLVPITADLVSLLAKIRERNMARGLADSTWLFPAKTCKCTVCGDAGHLDRRSSGWQKIKGEAGITGYGGVHRFRDTVKTRMSEHGIAGSVSEHILGHVIPGIEGIYNHAEQLPARRAALEWWARELDRIVAGADVVQIAASAN